MGNIHTTVFSVTGMKDGRFANLQNYGAWYEDVQKICFSKKLNFLVEASSSSFCDQDEGVAVAQGNMFLFRLDEFVLFPFAEDAADVIDIGACHFC